MHRHVTPATLHRHRFGDLIVDYVGDADTGQVGLRLLPADTLDAVVEPRGTLAGERWVRDPDQAPPAQAFEPLVQFSVAGEPYSGGFAQGRTLRGSAAVESVRLTCQRLEGAPSGRRRVVTALAGDRVGVEHRLTGADDGTVEIETTLTNTSDAPITLELLSSFTLGSITPYDSADAPGRLQVHRFRSAWSAEGRAETRSVEELHLERSWSGTAWLVERFGQVGTMPVRGWFPQLVVEDTVAGVCWGARLAWPGSWQLELARRGDRLALSGGLADREFGHWQHTLAPGASLTTPPAVLTAVHGDRDTTCQRLVGTDTVHLATKPAVEAELPIVVNEWCTTWGDPRHDQLLAIADRVSGLGGSGGLGARYLVIDAGWYKPTDPTVNWFTGHGDWQPNPTLFPDGLAATAAAIRERGLIPGLWFEWETVGPDASAFSLADRLLQRDGVPITSGVRRFWNLDDPWVTDHLTERVIDLLADTGMGYLKIDYNDTVGIGSDHPDGLGEGLRRQVLAGQRFVDRIAERLPDLVIENCSSGGHRLEAASIRRSSMSSFSDAHETPEIPVVAAALHRLILPRQSQIWAVLHADDSDERIDHSLAAGFLGRLCLSGDLLDLDAEQWTRVARACELYRRCARVIRDGFSVLTERLAPSWRHPQGWQAVVRHTDTQAMVVWHGFDQTPGRCEVDLPPGPWRAVDGLGSGGVEIDPGRLALTGTGPWRGRVVLLERT